MVNLSTLYRKYSMQLNKSIKLEFIHQGFFYPVFQNTNLQSSITRTAQYSGPASNIVLSCKLITRGSKSLYTDTRH